ncbi:hypothetical protein WG904_02840 [Pedobacter sp. Du54]
MNSRNLLKTQSLSLGSTLISTEVLAKIAENTYSYKIPTNPLHEIYT